MPIKYDEYVKRPRDEIEYTPEQISELYECSKSVTKFIPYVKIVNPDLGEIFFEPFDGLTFDAIQSDIRDSVEKYMPNLLLNNITISPADISEEVDGTQGENIAGPGDISIYRFPGKGTAEYTAKIRIDYSNNRSTFAQSDFIIINI